MAHSDSKRIPNVVSGTSKMRKTTKKRNRKTERNHLICLLRQQGATYKAIAERFGISICRVRQILEVWG